MTLKERVIVETYTGVVMTSAEERSETHKYMEELMGRPLFTHELADQSIVEQLKEKSKPDFLTLCITDKEWEELRGKCSELLCIYLSIGTSGYFGAMFLNRLLERYSAGERTMDLYESMRQAE